MKLGEALNERKRLMNRLPQLLSALQRNITVAQGAPINTSEPTAVELKGALDTESKQLSDLIVQINRTNNTTRLTCGLSIMEGIARRDYLKGIHATYTSFASHIRPRVEKDYRDSERTTYVAAEGIHPVGIKKQIADFAAEWRALDNELQQLNWTTDLV